MEPWIDYDLPAGLIAQQPMKNRADARLMVVDRERKSIDHLYIRDLPDLLRSADRLVLNDTKVIPAQLQGIRTATGGRWQGLYLGQIGEEDWKLVCKTRGQLKELESITLLDRDRRETGKLWLLEKLDDGQWRARPEGDLPALDLLERIGHVPLPPYIRGGNMVDTDTENYQTVFAKHPGAVAAPTAGLHFTRNLLEEISRKGVGISAVTLHVGMGTFRPIGVENLADHPMHSEWAGLSPPAAKELTECRAGGGRIVGVGTTVARVLETVSARNSAENDSSDLLCSWQGETNLFIRPPYQFRAMDVLLTNFHFPRTTLLLLVQAFGGSELIRAAYEEAIREEYRFYSYGDAMLVV